MTTPLESAEHLDSLGWNVLPARFQEKRPAVDWREFEDTRTTDRLAGWFKGRSQANFFVVTGEISQLVVIDCDNEEAVLWWRDRLGAELLDSTTCARTAKGWHFYLSLQGCDRDAPPNVSVNEEDGPAFDLRSTGTGVIAPPSVHESGVPYRWERGPSKIQQAPGVLWEAAAEWKSGPSSGGGVAGAGAGGGRSMLSHLLANPPSEGNRNSWLAAVLGHYAAQHRRFRDLYDIEAARAAAMCQPPLDAAEFEKTVESIWRAEHSKAPAGAPTLSEQNGWLVDTGRELAVQTLIKTDAGSVYSSAHFADFGLEALGVIRQEEGRSWDLVLRRRDDEEDLRAVLPASTIADARKMRAWLADLGCGVAPPAEASPKMDWTERLRRFIEAQEPPEFDVVPTLGWHGSQVGFVCHQGVIRPGAQEIEPWADKRPAPHLPSWAPYNYGFEGGPQQARAVLAEVMQFHHPEVCAVFGAWWTMCLLKPQVMRRSSLFPFMALEAPSESGKTTGFFSMLTALAGNQSGQILATAASLRDYLSAHQSGIVWVDDPDRLDHLTELLRSVTGEGTMVKKGQDNHSQISAHLVAPVVVSGESLNMSDQKALIDRTIQLDVPSPTRRRSTKGDWAQWRDVVELREKHPDLSVFAGTLVAQVLDRQSMLADLELYRPGQGGRWADKIAIVRLGARILEQVLEGDGEPSGRFSWISEQVDAWAGRQHYDEGENTLTLKVLPLALAQTGYLAQPSPPQDRWPQTPVLVRGGRVLFSPRLLARWWFVYRSGRVEGRTETEEAMAGQARAMGLGRTENVACASMGGASASLMASYIEIPERFSRVLLARSRGEDRRTVSVEAEQAKLELWAEYGA